MSIYQVLQDEHRKVQQLFREIDQASDPDDKFRKFEELHEEWLMHSKAEDKVFYEPLDQKGGELADRIRLSREEHTAVEAICAQIQDIEPSDPSFSSKMKELESLVNDHVRDEEQVVFARAREAIGEDEDDRLTQVFAREKVKVEQKIEAPGAPEISPRP